MWEKISKEMQLPWRAAEAMHWQIGEVEMAQRANVPVFHLAGQSSSQGGVLIERVSSTSPPSAVSPPSSLSYSHTHNHSLPQISMAQPPHSVSPVQSRLRRNSSGSSPVDHPPPLRRRADSARSVPTASSAHRTLLPPLGELTGMPQPHRYTLPPVVPPSESGRR